MCGISITSSHFRAAGSADSAVIVNLTPGLYTAQATSDDAAGGTGLIEIYELP